VASDDVGHCHFKRHFKRDDLELTRRSRFQADRAHICTRVVEVAACETPPTLCDRRVNCLSPGQPRVGRAFSLVDRRVAKVILYPLYQDLSHHVYVGENINSHRCLRRGELCLYTVGYDQSSFSTIADILILAQIRSNGVLYKTQSVIWTVSSS
jgi:hypothetical protein